MNGHLLPILAVIAAAGLAGCAGQSQYHVHFLKGYGSGDQNVRIITVTQTDPLSFPSRAKPANRLGAASQRPFEGDGGRHEEAAGQRFSDGGE